jgi:hypothetical protein
MLVETLPQSAIPHGHIRRMARAKGLAPALSLDDPVGPPRLMVAFSTVMREAARLAEEDAPFA